MGNGDGLIALIPVDPSLFQQQPFSDVEARLWRSIIRCLVLSAALIPISASAIPPPPSPEEQATIIAEARALALGFSDRLPDFICTEVARRWVRRSGHNSTTIIDDPFMQRPWKVEKSPNEENWKLKDTLTVQLSYFEQKEQYMLVLVNGKPSKQSYESVGGATSYGDFGSALGILFQQSSRATFGWDHWGLLNHQPVMVFNFSVSRSNSQWRVAYESKEELTGFRGLVFIEPNLHEVLKLEVNADEIPKNFPIQKSGVEMDYRMQTVGNREYLLPLRAVDWNDTKSFSTRNEAEFRRYRKFSADSKIEFDTPAPLPEDQIEEQVPK